MDVENTTKLLSDLIHRTDSISSKFVILGRRLREGDSVDNYLDPHLYLGQEFEKAMSQLKFPDENKIDKDANN